MPRRALLRFRNPDSTQDINDRLRGLFNKGRFSGGNITPVPGVLRIDLGPFATVGSDGMFVRESSESTRLDVVAGFKNYIVIRQEYVSDDAPIVSIESLTEPEFFGDGTPGFQGPDNPSLIVFGVVNVPAASASVTADMIEFFEADIVDSTGRAVIRGRLEDSADLPSAGLNLNRPGDSYIVTEGTGDFPSLFTWNGVTWINITDTIAVLNLLSDHRQNLLTDEIHLTDLQAEAVAGTSGTPSDTNRYVTDSDPRLPTQDENDALEGNFVSPGVSLEDAPPSDSNRYVTSSKVFAAPAELEFSSPTPPIELGPGDGPYFVGAPSDPEALVGTVQRWFTLYSSDESEDSEYLNSEFEAVRVVRVETGPVGGPSSGNELNPQTDARVDDLGFFDGSPGDSLFLITDNDIDSDVRVSYGKRTLLGNLLPQLLMSRGPQGGQVDTRLARLLLGTPNAHFSDDIWTAGIQPGDVVSFNTVTGKFVLADPDGGLTPIGVRGNSNNLVMEGLLTTASSSFSVDFLYADKANPGELTNTPNEWFIGRGISSTQLLVNMSPIPQDPDDFIPPIAFPESLFDPGVQPGQVIAWYEPNSRFELADPLDPDRLPVGVRGNNNNVIQSGKYQAQSGTPFVSGTNYYAGEGGFAGTLVTSPANDWFIGQGIDSTTLLVNANATAVPNQWDVEHEPQSGFHKFSFGDDSVRDALLNPVTGTPDVGMIFIRTDLTPPRIEYWNGVSWEEATSDRVDIPSGSTMLFIQDFVPTGWTIDTNFIDRTIVIVNEASGGATAGSWTVSGFQADPHAITIAELPAHAHDQIGNVDSDIGGLAQLQVGSDLGGPQVIAPTDTPQTGSVGSGDAHEHTVSNDGNWRPAYVGAIVCVRD